MFHAGAMFKWHQIEVATTMLDPKAIGEGRQKNIENGAAELLMNFLPKKKSSGQIA